MSRTLLIGAGFTKNFGGYLAEEVFLKILNHPKLTPKLKEELWRYLEHSDFEMFYENVRDSQSVYTDPEKALIEQIVLDIFKALDERLERTLQSTEKFSYLSVISLILFFSKSQRGSGYIFSLNQDILLERLFSDYLKSKSYRNPGGWKEPQGELLPHYGPINPPHYKYHVSDTRGMEFTELDKITQDEVDNWKKQHAHSYELETRRVPCLLKLHGSYWWRQNKANEINNVVWILGKNKEEKIDQSPMLKLYFDKFREVLQSDSLELFVVGYSFRDPHINKMIGEACKNGAKLIVVDICPLSRWLEQTEKEFKEIGLSFEKAWLKAYHKEPFNELFYEYLSQGDFLSAGDNEAKSHLLETLGHPFKHYRSFERL